MKVTATTFSYTAVPTSAQKAKTEYSEAPAYRQAQPTSPSPTDASTPKTTVSSASTQDTPLQAYALPYWLKGFGRDLTHEAAVGTPASYVDPKNAGFAAASSEELAEYSSLLQKHLNDLYEKNGLMDLNVRYKATTSIPGLEERLHAQFNASISSDARMMGLMNKMGVEVA